MKPTNNKLSVNSNMSTTNGTSTKSKTSTKIKTTTQKKISKDKPKFRTLYGKKEIIRYYKVPVSDKISEISNHTEKSEEESDEEQPEQPFLRKIEEMKVIIKQFKKREPIYKPLVTNPYASDEEQKSKQEVRRSIQAELKGNELKFTKLINSTN